MNALFGVTGQREALLRWRLDGSDPVVTELVGGTYMDSFDSDPDSGALIGAEDERTNSFLRVDPVSGTLSPMVPIPEELIDPDGLAVFNNHAYVVVGNTQEGFVIDLTTGEIKIVFQRHSRRAV